MGNRQKIEGPPAGAPAARVVGLEAEFTVLVDGEPQRPEELFGTPRSLVRFPMLRRAGRSCHLPSGGAMYFDTGVIEVATPIIELEHGCAVRVARSLFEQVEFLRGELDHWDDGRGREIRLQGFSAHYNISLPHELRLTEGAGLQFALLLAHILPLPVMLLAANRRSTGIGVRPRGNRVEITADFTTDPELVIATASLIFGIVTAVAEWRKFGLESLAGHGIPVVQGFFPRRHTSRKGWLARFDCFPRNPFAIDVNESDWMFTDGKYRSLRDAAAIIARKFGPTIRRYSDNAAVAHLHSVLDGRARSLLDFENRPPQYDDVGRAINWGRRRVRTLPRSAYEQIIHRVIKGSPVQINGRQYLPVRMGWYEIEFRDVQTSRCKIFNLDDLVSQQ